MARLVAISFVLLFCVNAAPAQAQPTAALKEEAKQALSRGELQRAFLLLDELAKRADAWACFNLGDLYYSGAFGGRNLVNAAIYYRCAEQLKFPGGAAKRVQVEQGMLAGNILIVHEEYTFLLKQQSEYQKAHPAAPMPADTPARRQALGYLEAAMSKGRTAYAQTLARLESLRQQGYDRAPATGAAFLRDWQQYEISVQSYAHQLLMADPQRAALVQRELPDEWRELTLARR